MLSVCNEGAFKMKFKYLYVTNRYLSDDKPRASKTPAMTLVPPTPPFPTSTCNARTRIVMDSHQVAYTVI